MSDTEITLASTDSNTSSRQDQQNLNPNEKRLRQQKILNTKTYQQDNLPYGDNIKTQTDYEGIVFHNINGRTQHHGLRVCRNKHIDERFSIPQME
jgi:hypothetical protein